MHQNIGADLSSVPMFACTVEKLDAALHKLWEGASPGALNFWPGAVTAAQNPIKQGIILNKRFLQNWHCFCDKKK
ncbi:hypothetical protein [Dethiobacter alkaliphilus]|uniref:hypothetical protein n=1 Tax=Dethiobacter alkaliphilus TaxID=427926 RepID=UPI0022263F50|nr:hypothetical protein [Dethiobacter alkaliphilus]MCW3488780.1 hypothetical protein [Dethiobacter alkaliphilus]